MNIDTSTPQGRLTSNLLGSIAQFVREMLKRQKVGMAAVKEVGKYVGKPPQQMQRHSRCCHCTPMFDKTGDCRCLLHRYRVSAPNSQSAAQAT
ncbi:hypothetical protein IFU01_08675 [Oxalobacteraceae sp. CFBP 8763]|nr:hypothetical protein [Oxalobacteraceae sp. CFBP 8763]